MAATNPFKTHDLVAKYGWQAMVYLSNLGIRNLAEAQLLFVDSGSANKLDADDTEHGHSFEKPLATLDYAIGLCTASEQAIILLAPGHVEDYDDSTTGFDADVVGVVILGLGVGSLKPRFDFNDATSKCIMGANDVQIKNVVFRPSVATVAIGLDYETDVTGVVLEDVEFAMGEKGDGTDEFVKTVHLTSGNHDCVFENVKILAHASCGGASYGIHVDAASHRLIFKNVVIDGPYTDYGIHEDAAGLNHIVEDCSIDTAGTNYDFHNSSTFAKRVRNLDAGALEDAAENLIGRNDADNVVSTSAVVGNADGSVLERLEIIQTYTDTLETAVGDINNTVNLNTAVVAAPVAKSMMDILNENRAGANTYDSSTDSLEAISNLLRDDADVLAGINLDHFMKTAVEDEEAMAEIANGSALAHILVSGAAGATTDYTPSTMSLQAISEAVAGYTTAIDSAPTEKSLQDILHKSGSFGFDNTKDSLEMISDKVGDYAGTAGAGVAESLKASLTLAHTDLDTIVADTKQIADFTLPVSPTTKSLASYIASGGTSLGQTLPADMSLVDLIGNFTGSHDETEQNDNIKASLDLAHTDLDAILADTAAWDSSTKARTILYGSDTAGATAAKQDTAQTDLDTLTGTGGANLATATQTQVTTIETAVGLWDTATKAKTILYGSDTAGATAAKQDTAQTDLDMITGASGAKLLTATQASVDAIEADTAVIEPGARRIVIKSTGNLTAFGVAKDLFTVTGDVLVRVCASVDVAVTSGGTPTLEVGVSGNTACLCVQDTVDGTAFDIGDSWSKTIAADANGAEIADEYVLVGNGVNIILTASADTITAGDIDFYCEWIPLSSGAAVAASA